MKSPIWCNKISTMTSWADRSYFSLETCFSGLMNSPKLLERYAVPYTSNNNHIGACSTDLHQTAGFDGLSQQHHTIPRFLRIGNGATDLVDFSVPAPKILVRSQVKVVVMSKSVASPLFYKYLCRNGLLVVPLKGHMQDKLFKQ